MKKTISFIIFFLVQNSYSQTLNLNEDYIIDFLRISQLKGDLSNNFTFSLKPFSLESANFKVDSIFLTKDKYSPTILEFFGEKGKFKVLPINYNIEFNSHHPYNRNNGSMIPNRGYQQILSAGLFLKIGPLSIQLKPEHLYSQNKDFEGFGEGPNGHYPIIWAKRYKLWNRIDLPERFGEREHNKTLLGQSYIKLNYKKFSFGITNENIWWGPSIRNSIMMSNHARGFKHITFNTNEPIESKIGNFEWQLISAKLENSGFKPPNNEIEYAGTKIFVPKINQNGETDDWRYLQALNFSYSPKWISGLTLGYIRWAQMYSALVNGEYTWMKGSPNWFPVFTNIFRKNDKNVDYEMQTNQSAGFYLRWFWDNSRAEIYAEYYHNDSKFNFRDLLLDSDHSRAVTIGIQKVLDINSSDFLFSWEWTQMEQTASRLIRNAGSWYEHSSVMDGYTNYGEVLGAGIGPGSNSHYFALNKIKNTKKIGLALEIIDQDNDFYHEAFSSAQDFRRYWKDFNLHFNFSKKYEKIWLSSNIIYSRSLNYQWDLSENSTTYYHPGNDVNNFHVNFKITYMFF